MAEAKMKPRGRVCRPGPPSWRGKGVEIAYTPKGSRIVGSCQLASEKASQETGEKKE